MQKVFNAATAVTPWRTRPGRDDRPTAGVFNAATAVTPWRTALEKALSVIKFSLQCGHGSDAVENA